MARYEEDRSDWFMNAVIASSIAGIFALSVMDMNRDERIEPQDAPVTQSDSSAVKTDPQKDEKPKSQVPPLGVPGFMH